MINIEKTMYFKTRQDVDKVYLTYVEENYPNRFQDSSSSSRIKIREFTKGFALQFGDYGPYLSNIESIK